jgi:Protein of unknown function (DUF1570)
MKHLLSCSLAHVLLAIAASATAAAQSERTLTLDGSWQTEEVELTDGRILRGLVDEEHSQRLQFLEMRRRAGRPIMLVTHSLARDEIVHLKRLPDDARVVLRERLEAVRNRAAIEATRAQNVTLQPRDRDGIRFWSHAGPWFQIEAALEPSELRRIVVRLEQVFRAFNQVLPPADGEAPQSPRPISFLVFGDHRQYAAYLRRGGIPIRNPAYFDPARRQVVVSSDLARLLDVARAVEDEHLNQLRELYPDDKVIAEALAHRDRRLDEGGYSDAERRRLLFLTRVRWRTDENAVVKQMRRIERRNRDAVQAEREDLERRLFHEAFHAYADGRLVGLAGRPLPRWLSEGLAQIFESPLFDADLLRIDAPDPQRLARLQADLASHPRLTLNELLSADQSRFLVPHDASGRTSERHYLYAWSVAYYLVFEHPRLTRGRLTEYAVASDSAEIAAFEELVGLPLAEFEAKWRESMSRLTSGDR